MVRSVACLAVLLALFEIGSCIRCYQCNTQNDKTCADTFKPGTQSVDCADEASKKYNREYLFTLLPSEIFGSVVGSPRYCHKIVTESGTIVRACLDGNPAAINKTCQVMMKNTEMASPDKKIKTCMACDKDNCNGAGSLTFSLPLAFVALIASYLLCKQ